MSSRLGTQLATATGNLLRELEARRVWRKQEAMSPHWWVIVSALGDFLFAGLAAYCAYRLRFHSFIRDIGISDNLSTRQYMGHMALGSLTMVLATGWQGIYHSTALLRNRWVASRIAKAVLLWTLGFLALTLALKLQPAISRIYVALNGACALLFLLVWRAQFNRFLRSPSRIAALQRRTVFVGWNDDAHRLWNTLIGDRAHAFDMIGWVDASGWRENTQAPSNIPFLGYLEELQRIIARNAVDMVIVADLPRQQLVELANLCEREMIEFKLAPSVFRIFVSGLSLETVAGTPVLGINRLPLDNTVNVLAKRCLDIAGALFGLAFSVPLVAIFGILVWLESPGSIFYRQRRWGINGAPFEIIKLRSMKPNAEHEKGAQWCTADDPRRLRVGAFMRKWNIDEVPQFWNVLKGDMSLVGPRPERPELIAAFKHEIPHYNARHHAKPGMTGWAQVKGLRGDTDLAERIKCDLWYLENWSLLLDLQIMFLTFFKRDNAY
ncbi:MAG: exopolysaccharide biosynthesis polyprenyl glycosylphosphotransferase [Prosthecobacter sp.]|nr:exopolysaccharide biosynthesis polyprenyl glycosylphosphotransferase [Prosthecobacter sp.]